MPGKIITQKGKLYIEYCHNNQTVFHEIPSHDIGIEVLRKIDESLETNEQDLKFEIFANKYLISAKHSCKPSTLDDYKALTEKHIIPTFGSIPINKIKKSDIREYLQSKLDMYSISTVKHLKVVLSNIFNIALENEVITINPTLNLKRLFPKQTKPDRHFLTKAEVNMLLETTQKHKPEFYPFMLVLARTGMRLGEAIALQWDDINFENKTITISRSITRKKIGKPKNNKSRKVDMTTNLSHILSELKKIKNNKWVFAINDQETPFNTDNFRKRKFKPLLKLANLPKTTRIHDLRHAYASTLIQEGTNLMYVKEQLGHHSIQITVDTYGHIEPDTNKKEIEILDK